LLHEAALAVASGDLIKSKVVASTYMPTDTTPPAPEMERLIQYCNHIKLPLIIGCDTGTNAHHFRWGS